MSSLSASARAARDRDDDAPVYVISVAAQLAGMHAQTLRQYDRLGLVSPSRTRGGGRRYSQSDVRALREIQQLSQDGVSLSGIARIFELERHVASLEARVDELLAERRRQPTHTSRVFSVSPDGDVYATATGRRPRQAGSGALVLWRPSRDS